MLPRPARLTRSAGFGDAVRRGRRAGGRLLVVHAAGDGAGATGPQVGFVVSKAVGNAVVRNRVKRRLRHLSAERLDLLPSATTVVVRALPASAEASYDALGAALDRGLERALDGATR